MEKISQKCDCENTGKKKSFGIQSRCWKCSRVVCIRVFYRFSALLHPVSWFSILFYIYGGVKRFWMLFMFSQPEIWIETWSNNRVLFNKMTFMGYSHSSRRSHAMKNLYIWFLVFFRFCLIFFILMKITELSNTTFLTNSIPLLEKIWMWVS